MAAIRKSLFLGVAAAIALNACAVTPRIQGSLDDIALNTEQRTSNRRLGDSVNFETGDVSLPLALEYADNRKKAWESLIDEKLRIQTGAAAVTFGSLLSALGLSLAGAGGPDLFTVLGLGGAAAVGGSRLLPSTAQLTIIQNGVGALDCLTTAADPYVIDKARAARLFKNAGASGAPASPTISLSRAHAEAIASGAEDGSAIRAVENALDSQGGLSLEDRLSSAENRVEAAKSALEQKLKTLPSGKTDERANLALRRAVTALAGSARVSDQFAEYKAGVYVAGVQLYDAVRGIENALRAQLIPGEATPERAAAAFNQARDAALSFFTSANAGTDLSQSLATLTGGDLEPGSENQATSVGKPDDALADEIAALNGATDTLLKQAREANGVVTQFAKEVGKLGDAGKCPQSVSPRTLIVTPEAAIISLGAGDKETIVVVAGKKPVVAKTQDPLNVLTVDGPTLDSASVDRYTIDLAAAKSVAKASTAVVEISLEGRREIKTIAVSASPPATVTVSPTSKTIARGATGDFVVTASDGETPQLWDRNERSAPEETIATAEFKVKDADRNEFTMSVKVHEKLDAKEDKINLTVASADGRASDDFDVVVPPASGAPSSAPGIIGDANELEKLPKLVAQVQKVLNGELGLSGDEALPLSGEYDARTSQQVKAFQQKSGLSPQNGRLDQAVLTKVREAVLKLPETKAAHASEGASSDTIGKVEKALYTDERFRDVRSFIEQDGALDEGERKAIWSVQLRALRDGGVQAEQVDLNGALGPATVSYITGNVSK